MSSLIKEIQKDIILSNKPINEILRKAYIVAQKIGDEDFTKWVGLELNGYENEEDLPEYRKVNGSLKAVNPVRGLIPVHFEDVDDEVLFSKSNIYTASSNLEDTIKNKGKNSILEMPIPAAMRPSMFKITGGMTPVYILNSSDIFGIIEKVKNIIFKWALELEAKGILGEGVEFSEKEKESAKVVNFNINQMINSQIQNESSNSKQILLNEGFDVEKIEEFLSRIKEKMSELEINSEQKSELNAEITTLESQISSPKPKMIIVKESLNTVRNILENIAGSIIASNLLRYLGQINI